MRKAGLLDDHGRLRDLTAAAMAASEQYVMDGRVRAAASGHESFPDSSVGIAGRREGAVAEKDSDEESSGTSVEDDGGLDDFDHSPGTTSASVASDSVVGDGDAASVASDVVVRDRDEATSATTSAATDRTRCARHESSTKRPLAHPPRRVRPKRTRGRKVRVADLEAEFDGRLRGLGNLLHVDQSTFLTVTNSVSFQAHFPWGAARRR